MNEPRPSFDPAPWRDELLGFARRLGARGEAEDVVQDAFLRALRNPPRTHARAWLYRATISSFFDRRRAERRFEEAKQGAAASMGDAATAPSAASTAARRDLAEEAWTAALALPEKQRLALELKFRRHMDYDEIAVALACSAGVARQHVYLAVKSVRDRLGSDDDA